MEIKIDLFSIIITLGIIQGFFLSFIFFKIKKVNKKANTVLSFFLFIISFSICSSVLLFTNLFRYVPHLIRIEVILLFMFPAVLFLYVKVLTIHDYKFSKMDLLHFIPAAAAFIILSPFFFSDAQNKINYYQGILYGNVVYLDLILVITLNFLEWFYIIKILRLVKAHQDNIKQNYSNIEEINLSWIKVFTIAYVFVAFIAQVFSFLILFFNYPYSMFYRFLPVAVTASIFYLGYEGLMQQEIFTISRSGRGRKGRINEAKYERYFKRIIQVIEDQKLFLNPELTISDIGKKLSITRETVARVILSGSGKIFYDFLNEFRVKEARKYLLDRKNGLTLPAIALRSGFKSETIFNSVFEKFTKLTPTQLRIEFHPHKTAKSKKTIAIFLDSLYDRFGESILYGVSKLAREQNLNLLCFNGGNFNAPIYNYSQKTKIYDLASSYSLDGIIMISVLLGGFIHSHGQYRHGYRRHAQYLE
jgi:AraC-like DNA-binding protein